MSTYFWPYNAMTFRITKSEHLYKNMLVWHVRQSCALPSSKNNSSTNFGTVRFTSPVQFQRLYQTQHVLKLFWYLISSLTHFLLVFPLICHCSVDSIFIINMKLKYEDKHALEPWSESHTQLYTPTHTLHTLCLDWEGHSQKKLSVRHVCLSTPLLTTAN